MEVILLERVEKLGQMGQVVKVRPGFARNFLLPKKKALRATKANLAFYEEKRVHLEEENQHRRQEAEILSGRMQALMVTVVRQAGESGVLYGSVSSRDIAQAAQAAGHTLDRNQVAIEHPIKTLGLTPVRLNLHPEVSLTITVNVARSLEEAAIQAERGGMVTAAQLAQEQDAADRAAEALEAEAAAEDDDEA